MSYEKYWDNDNMQADVIGLSLESDYVPEIEMHT